MKILITGAHGQVGHSLTTQLANRSDVELEAVDRDELDITDAIAVNHIVSEFNPDFIINAAAHTAVDKAEQEQELSFAINRDGPKYLAQAARTVGATILHISTDYVFAGDKSGLYLETDPVNPQSVYGESKLAGELAVAVANPKHIILRTAWVFCEHGNNFIKTMLRLGADRDSLGIVGDQFGGPTYAGDIASALIAIADSLHKTPEKNTDYGIYHFSGEPHVSWFEFAQEIFQQAEQQAVLSKRPKLNLITTADFPTPAKRPENSKLDCTKIKNTFAIQPSDWKQQLSNLISYI